jgi:hypothetical protein
MWASSHELFAGDAPDLAEILEVFLAVLAAPLLMARPAAAVAGIVDARLGKGNASLDARTGSKAVLRCPAWPTAS